MRFLTVLVLMIGMIVPAAAQELMSVKQARVAALAGEVVLIDIRTPEEWKKTGLPDVAHALDMRSEKFIDGLKRLMETNPGVRIAMICATGGRSSFVAKALKEHGVAIVNVREGMFGSADGPGWLKQSLPVRTPDEPRVE